MLIFSIWFNFATNGTLVDFKLCLLFNYVTEDSLKKFLLSWTFVLSFNSWKMLLKNIINIYNIYFTLNNI